MRVLLRGSVGKTFALLVGGVAALALAGCSINISLTPTAVPGQPSAVIGATATLSIRPSATVSKAQTPQILPPVASPLPTPQPATAAIAIDTPPSGTLVGSPVVLSGRTSIVPVDSILRYRITDASGRQIGLGSVLLNGSPGQPGSFNASLDFAPPAAGGNIRAELFENAKGPGTGSTLDMFVAPPQAITFTSPPPNTAVGSPMVVTGQLARLPFQSNLAYRFIDAQGQSLGEGLLPVSGQEGRPSSFSASLPLYLPVAGGAIRLELYDQDGVTGATVSSAALPLQVAPQSQNIIFDSPPSGTNVGSPVVVTGRTVRYPAQGTLGYRVTDNTGAQIGNGAFAVTGALGQGSQFNASLVFNQPAQGGNVRIDLLDQDAATGVIIASASLNVQVSPAQQSITIDSPPPGTSVGSPVVLTGRTSRYPINGALSYRVVDGAGTVLGTGRFPVNGPIGQATSFNASLTFNAPASSGPIRIDIIDQDTGNGTVAASTSITLRVDLPAPAQQIIIETPAQNAFVGSPVVVTGRTTRYPNGGRLSYTVRAESGATVSAGNIDVVGNPSESGRFTASINLSQVPGQSGSFVITIYEPDAAGNPVASATLQVRMISPR